MKNFLTCLILSSNFLSVQAQQERFIYLQMENKQPFFVRINEKVHNSYSAGYLVIPKLDEGIYTLTLGFPRSASEQQFNCTLKNRDVGYIIKSEEGIWQLLNVQTADLTVALEVTAKPAIEYERATDPFSRMLANAVNDSTILRKDVAIDNVVEKLQVKDSAAVVMNRTVAVSDNALVADSSNKDVAIATPEKIIDTTQRDTTALITRNDIAISNPDSAVSESAKKVIATETLSDKIIEQKQKDSVTSVIPNEVVISNPDVLKDSALATMKNDMATTKQPSRKKKSKKDNTVVQDSSLVKNDVVKETIPEKINEKDTDTSILPGDETVLVKSVIKRRSRKNNRDGLEMMYVDTYGDLKDTIMVLIPSDKKKKQDDIKITDPVVTVADVAKEDKAKEVEKDKADYKITREEKEIIKEAKKDLSKSTMINSDCKYFAEEADFLKIRKKMVAEDNDEDMIKSARKIFKTRCFTTEQIKNLSVLFLKDEGKFMFFEVAYAFVSDSDLYYTLENQLTDFTYLVRFKAMINK